MQRVMSVRLPDEDMKDLETLAQFDGVAVAKEIREAVRLLVEQRRSDPAFRARVNAALEKTRALLNQEEAADIAVELQPLGDPARRQTPVAEQHVEARA